MNIIRPSMGMININIINFLLIWSYVNQTDQVIQTIYQILNTYQSSELYLLYKPIK